MATPPRRRKTPAMSNVPASSRTRMLTIDSTPIAANVIARYIERYRWIAWSRSVPASHTASAATNTAGANAIRLGGSIRKLNTSMR